MLENLMKAYAPPVFKKGKKKDQVNYKPVSLTLILENVMKQPILGTISRHQREFMHDQLYDLLK